MKRTRREFTAEFKAKVAIESLRATRSVHELAAMYNVHKTQVINWTQQLTTQASKAFERNDVAKLENKATSGNETALKLYQKIGQLVSERDSLMEQLDTNKWEEEYDRSKYNYD